MEQSTAKFDKGKNAVLVENNAQTIYDHLNELEKKSKDYSKRWFWELLQNAKDSVDNNSKVSVKVILDDNRLSFLHTGDAFEENDILHLIFHGSSKKSLEGKTGRFGTGFMATHLLSRKVNITGKLADDTYFQFDLSREAESVLTQQENLESSYKLFCESNRADNYISDDYNTIFSYELSEPSLNIAKEGINQLQQILPFVMAFNEKIENIEIETDNDNISIKRGIKDNIIFGKSSVISQEIFYNNKIDYVIFTRTDVSEIAVLLEKKGDVLKLVNLDDKYPKLYFDFPLFGTEKFGCPVVINSTKFDLMGERNGIYLVEDDKDKPTIIENKKIIEKSLNTFDDLIKFLSERQVIELYNIFKLKKPFEYDWLHNDWLKNLYTSKISDLLETECMVLENIPLRLKNIVLPISKNKVSDRFYKLVTEFIHSSTPSITEVPEWIEVAEGFSKLENKELVDYDFVLNENKLCRKIEDKITLDEINSSIKRQVDVISDDLSSSIKWLNELFQHFSKDETEYLISHYNIIPNQERKLVKKELTTPYIDNIGNEDIKKVIKEFGWNIKSDLIFPGIIIKEDVLQSYTLEKSLNYISNSSDKVSEEQLSDKRIRNALISNFKWLIKSKKTPLIKDAFVIVEKGRENSDSGFLKRRLYQTYSDKLLAPSSIWHEDFSHYKEIVLKKFILIDEYANQLTSDDLNFLQSEDFIYLSPLIIRKSPTKNELKLLVKNPEFYCKLLNEKEEIIDNNLEYSDIAYLTRADDSILSKTGDSIKSAKALLKFLLSQVLDKDVLFNQTTEILNIGESITINKCLWVARLRDTQWVPVKSPDGEKQNNSERPSVANITELIRDEVEILKIIKTKNAALFFNHLGISVADIIRNSLTNEEEKLKWDMTFSQLLTNGNINPDLAVEMLGDPRLQEVYLNQKKEREQIKANQNIGYLFESIFKKIFISDDYKKQGFSIERTAIGSDFGVIYEEDIIDEKGTEIIYRIGQVLIELKATSKKYAEMTPRQAEEATNNINNYVLAVLPLNNYELNEVSVKEHSKFIVKIANPLLNRYNELKSYNEKKIISTQEQKDVRLNIEDGNIRYQVKSELWETGSLNFEEFINWLKDSSK